MMINESNLNLEIPRPNLSWYDLGSEIKTA
jgi:hypothetical protein